MLISCILALCLPLQNTQSKDVSSEISELLKQLTPRGVGLRTWMGSPVPDEIERIRTRLVEIANQSAQTRMAVIKALVPILNAPKQEFDFQEVDQWRTAVALLGELNAIEAIDNLVSNIKWTSYNSFPHPTPPVRAALVRIGEPAVPSLLKALSNPNKLTRWESTEALVEIGTPSVYGLLEVLADRNPDARTAAAYALARIESPLARDAIEIALSLESNEEIRKQLKSDIELMDQLDCLKDRSKCK